METQSGDNFGAPKTLWAALCALISAVLLILMVIASGFVQRIDSDSAWQFSAVITQRPAAERI